MARGDFFSGSERRDDRIAGNLGPSTPIKNYGGNMGFSQDFGAGRVTNVKPKKGFSLKDVYGDGTPRAKFFSPSGNELGQIASATSDLSGLIARDTSEDQKFKRYLDAVGIKQPRQLPDIMKRMLRENMRDDEADGKFKDGQFVNQLPKNYGEQEQKVIQDNEFNKYLKNEFGTDDLNYGDKQFLRESFDKGDEYRRFNLDQSFKKPETDTKIAMDNLGGYAAAIGGLGSMAIMGANAIKNTIQNLAPKFKKDIDQRINPEANKVSIGDRVGGFLNNIMGISPVAAGTLDANQQVAQVSERPKLNYVNPDAKTMSISEIKDAFKPSNLFGYKDKFGRFDDPGSPLARDRAETMQRVAQNFTSPIVGDARTIAQIRADQDARMRENARLRNESFQRGERVQQKSADVTFGTGMLSNPAYRGLRENMSPEAQKKYDQSARDATEMARTDPSLGNVAMQTFNRISGLVGGPQASLEKIGERQLRLANKEINRPTYQKEAYARKMLGITNEQLKARNLQQIRVNAAARNQSFQADRRAKAVERVARRYGQNTGSGRTGGFGSGTVGKGMSSNPASQRQQGVGVSANNLSRHSVGHSSTQPGAKGGSKKGGVSGKTGRPKGGGPKGGGGPSGGGPKSSGQNKSLGKKNRVGRKVRCDIQTKIDITSLTNQNLIKDDLATVAYFVQELIGE